MPSIYSSALPQIRNNMNKHLTATSGCITLFMTPRRDTCKPMHVCMCLTFHIVGSQQQRRPHPWRRVDQWCGSCCHRRQCSLLAALRQCCIVCLLHLRACVWQVWGCSKDICKYKGMQKFFGRKLSCMCNIWERISVATDADGCCHCHWHHSRRRRRRHHCCCCCSCCWSVL